MTDIAGRTAFITGGANGIGLGIARAFAREGVKLVLVDLDADALKRARDELSAVTDVATAVLDVRDRGEFNRIADKVEAQVGPVSLLFNNAGVAGGGPADKLTYALWDWGMGVNLDGVVNGVQTFLPRIVERDQGGHIVNTASGAGLFAGPSGVLYHTAKFAVVGMSESLGLDLEPQGIGLTVLCPGPVATDIIARTRAAQPKVTGRMSADQRRNAFARNKVMEDYLAHGTLPDAVGNMVLAAVRENRMYVHTCRSSAERIAERGKALLEAMPA